MLKKITYTDITKIGDPFILVDNNLYYLYATSSDEGIKVWTSRDLKSFNDEGYCYEKKDSFGYQNFWAPEVIKHQNKYIMYFTAKSRSVNSLRIGIATSDSPLGPFKDVKENEPMFDYGYASIDASCFIDNDSQGYLYFVKDCSENIINGVHTSQIYVVKLDESLTKIISDPQLILEPDNLLEKKPGTSWCWNEGPYVINHQNTYYLCYSYNAYDDPNYSVGLATSKSPLGPFIKDPDNPILTKVPNEISGPGHNMLFYDLANNLITAFHIHTDILKPSGDRRVCFAKCYFEENNGLKKLKIDYQ